MSKRWLVGIATVAAAAAAALAVGAAHRGGGSAAPRRPPLHAIDERGHLSTFRRSYEDLLADRAGLVRRLAIPYVADDGARRTAYVVLPRWYGPRRHPPIPLVISPHGRGVSAVANLRFWRSLPAFGPFALVSPEGQGRRLVLYSWGWKGQIDDLARMPSILSSALPWLRIDRKRIYAVGSSMGGQETLLLVARHPTLLAGAVALDSATDMAARYRAFARLPGGVRLQRLAREEIGGTPWSVPRAYAERSPSSWAADIARSGVPLQIWWSTRDRIVTGQKDESGRLFRAIERARPRAPVTQYVGAWAHSREFHDTARLPLALVRLHLIELSEEPPAGALP
ncbi:Alpha/beta hydrolase family [Gaiella occulta]|uniref:Alpha/beta hydrolase family n=1 Tax=Gaiella occulta TaxID=1002870 RepID=A0A7M2Z2K3_9ACTN|nr:prolyl oligopeptidase family serine peptidase [Gaiella occulta]RDI76204.1 Alpha/beta hydrolase family [Gaiella occulta]